MAGEVGARGSVLASYGDKAGEEPRIPGGEFGRRGHTRWLGVGRSEFLPESSRPRLCKAPPPATGTPKAIEAAFPSPQIAENGHNIELEGNAAPGIQFHYGLHEDHHG